MVTMRHGHEVWLYVRLDRGDRGQPLPGSGSSFYRVEKDGKVLTADLDTLDEALQASDALGDQGDSD